MKRRFVFGKLQVCLLLWASGVYARAQFNPQNTDIPNEFAFVSAHYFVSKDATNASITVRFSPGNRSWSGSVCYTTQNGSAVANQDYTPVSGTLHFSGDTYQSFSIPLKSNGTSETKTIHLQLTPSEFDPNAILSRSNADLSINLPPPPDLKISVSANGMVILSWPDDGTQPLLERWAPPATNWSALPPAYSDGNGLCWYGDSPPGPSAFYRLRREQ